MKRILATIFAGMLGASMLAVTAARADGGRDGREQQYEWRQHGDRDRDSRRDHDRDDDDVYVRRAERRDRDDRDRRAAIDVATRDLGLHVDIGGWLARR